ncbi:MAG TPA: dethiobiotin synthase [Polyangia bacterium]|nr:dethiobiotin synthase [Polyangia bacterium]
MAGTDTGVGKTEVATAILRHVRNAGGRPIPFKPVETGADPRPLDALRLYQAAQPPVPPDRICLYPLPLPAAPQAAAERSGVSISAAGIRERAADLAAAGDALLVEAAGGLLVPYTPGLTGADLAQLLGLPILLVGRTALGTVNHMALSVNEVRRRGLVLHGLILSQTNPDHPPHEASNLPLIRQLTGIDPFGILPHVPGPTPATLATALAGALTRDALARLVAPLAPRAGSF